MLHKSEALNASKIALEASEMIQEFWVRGVMPAVSFFKGCTFDQLTFQIKGSAQIKVRKRRSSAPFIFFMHNFQFLLMDSENLCSHLRAYKNPGLFSKKKMLLFSLFTVLYF